ncbi:uncharacterized protein LOC127441525 isoform X2 [Myxocyprinus asiaticus]|uniref:uncharacterized protein LOC127441525 isoform X2 n=1 Tax=Myxocyprinus asiaticus TaxID=70543 RepID=UPI0022213A6D|nr:uncharacterized protein LOC127441525 isoform X2 [Myxocyprinus asiaticus]
MDKPVPASSFPILTLLHWCRNPGRRRDALKEQPWPFTGGMESPLLAAWTWRNGRRPRGEEGLAAGCLEWWSRCQGRRGSLPTKTRRGVPSARGQWTWSVCPGRSGCRPSEDGGVVKDQATACLEVNRHTDSGSVHSCTRLSADRIQSGHNQCPTEGNCERHYTRSLCVYNEDLTCRDGGNSTEQENPTDPSVVIYWSLSVAVFSIGGMVSSFLAGFVSDFSGSWRNCLLLQVHKIIQLRSIFHVHVSG